MVAIFSLQMLTGQQPIIFGDGSKTRDYCYVSDIVEANIIALNSPVNGVYNLGRGIEVSDLEVFEAVRAAVGADIAPVFAPIRPGEVEHIALDASRAERELGWRWKVGLTEGVAAAVAHYREATREDGAVSRKGATATRDDRRDSQPDQDQKPRGDQELQEGDSLTGSQGRSLPRWRPCSSRCSSRPRNP